MPVEVPPCLLCPVVTVEAEVGECDGRGRREVTVTAVLEREDGGSVGGRVVQVRDASGDDEIGDELAVGSDEDGRVELTGTAAFDGGQTIWVKVEVTEPGPGLCGSVVRDIDLAPCVECPEIEWDTDMGDRCDERGRRRVFVTARVQGTDGQTVTGRLLHEFAGTETEVDSGSDTDGSLLLEDDQHAGAGQSPVSRGDQRAAWLRGRRDSRDRPTVRGRRAARRMSLRAGRAGSWRSSACCSSSPAWRR